MADFSIIVIALIIVIIVLSVVIALLVSKRKDEPSGNAVSEKTSDSYAGDLIPLEEVTSLVFKNPQGEELLFRHPSEITDRKYNEIVISETGNVIQHAGQGALPEVQKAVTLNQLNEMAPNGLFTNETPIDQLSTYKSGSLNGKYSSTIYGKEGTVKHSGYEALDTTKLGAVSTVSIINSAVQGMAIMSGMYYLKQISESLQTIETEINKLLRLHKYEKVGTLRNCKIRLKEIVEKSYCDQADIYQIRNISDKAGEILEEYKLIYTDAYNDALNFKFKGGVGRSALEDYNSQISRMKESLQICMIADRIIDEAKLAEIVTRGKINANDRSINAIVAELQERKIKSFNRTIVNNADDIFAPLMNKARSIADTSLEGGIMIGDEVIYKRLGRVENNIEEIRTEAATLSDSVYLKPASSDKEEILLMLDEDTGKTRVFIPEDCDQ